MYNQDYLDHYGVLGMRWGFRKDRSTGRLRKTADVLRDTGKRAAKATKSGASKAGAMIKDEAGRYYLNPDSVKRGERIARNLVGGAVGALLVGAATEAAYGIAGEAVAEFILVNGMAVVTVATAVNLVNDTGGLVDAGSPVKRRK